MNCRDCQPLLSAYLDDGTLEARIAVEAHLRGCTACRALADDLAAIRTAAGSLEPLVPPARVWHQIAAATEVQPRQAPRWFGWRPLAAVAMTAVIAAGLWRVGSLLQPEGRSTSAPDVELALADADPEAHYTLAIAQLEEVTTADRDVLDPETAGAINAGLTVIDEAITESRAALRSEPQSESAQESLSAALRRKVALLQETVVLINEMRTGNEDTGGRIVSETN